jgi:hypothetical protein
MIQITPQMRILVAIEPADSAAPVTVSADLVAVPQRPATDRILGSCSISWPVANPAGSEVPVADLEARVVELEGLRAGRRLTRSA